MRLAVTPLQDVLSQLVRSPSTLIAPEARPYFRDVLDHSVRSNETIDALRDMLGTALNVNQALVTLAQVEVVKRLAGWAAVLAVTTLVASWYGSTADARVGKGGVSTCRVRRCAYQYKKKKINTNTKN